MNLKSDQFTSAFQVTRDNPLLGVDARLQLLRDVGQALTNASKMTGSNGRPGNLVGQYLVCTMAMHSIEYLL